MKNSNAKHICACDECGASIGELYPNNKDNISLPLTDISKKNKGDSETSYNDSKADILDFASRTHHFCNEACLGSHLNKRAKTFAKMKKVSKASYIDESGSMVLDISMDSSFQELKKKVIEINSDAAHISTKDRNNLKEGNFLDPKRRSFPIRPGHECTDLNAALHRIGTYTGSMSHSELHSKIMSRMKEHGCPLPKSDKK